MDREALGSPWRVSVSSFSAFAAGALVPILPYLLGARGWTGVILSAALTALALIITGFLLSFLTGRNAVYTAGRMLLVGGLASAVTFIVGRLIGASGI